MTFTSDGYVGLLKLLIENGYGIVDYSDWEESDQCVILRHDVDIDLQQAHALAQIEYRHNVKSTYFVLLTSSFYNMHSYRNRIIVKEIQDMGHTIGLHFDETAYPNLAGNTAKVGQEIKKELDILSEIIETDVTVFSYHRPTQIILDSDMEIERAINSYGNIFFRQFKYLSDSRMHWREPVLDIIRRREYTRLHILTHPFWYHNEEKSMKEILHEFINMAGTERYDNLNDNFTNLKDAIG